MTQLDFAIGKYRVSTRMEFMMRASFMVASALASGIITADAHTHNKTENNDAAYASTHIFQMPKKRMDGSGKSGKASWSRAPSKRA